MQGFIGLHLTSNRRPHDPFQRFGKDYLPGVVHRKAPLGLEVGAIDKAVFRASLAAVTEFVTEFAHRHDAHRPEPVVDPHVDPRSSLEPRFRENVRGLEFRDLCVVHFGDEEKEVERSVVCRHRFSGGDGMDGFIYACHRENDLSYKNAVIRTVRTWQAIR